MSEFISSGHTISYEHVWNPANSLPASSGTNTRDFVCFFLFWFLSLPLLWFPVHKMSVRRFSVPDSVTHTSGKSPLLCSEDSGYAHRSNRVPRMVYHQSTWHRSDRTTACFYPRIQSGLGNGREPHVVHQQHGDASHVSMPRPFLRPHLTLKRNRNAPDFASRASTPAAALWPQLFAFPLASSIICLIGILVSSSSQAIYGEAIWSPIDLLGQFLDDNPSHATRFGVCLILTTFTFQTWLTG